MKETQKNPAKFGGFLRRFGFAVGRCKGRKNCCVQKVLFPPLASLTWSFHFRRSSACDWRKTEKKSTMENGPGMKM